MTVSECKQTVSTADYTINYKQGDSLVCYTTGKEVVGNIVSAERCVYDSEGNRYFVTANELPTDTIAADENVLDVPVRKAYSATLSLTTTIGKTSTTKETTFIEAEDNTCTWTYAYPLYVKSGDAYYKADNTDTFGESGTFTDGDTITKTVTYTSVDENVVFFADAESAAGTDFNYSNGGVGTVAAQNARDRGISVGELPAGIYELVVNVDPAEKNKRGLVIRHSKDDPFAVVELSNSDMTTGVKSSSFTLIETTGSLWINGANSGSAKTNLSLSFDYVLVRKTADLPSTIETTVGTTGYATLCSPYNLDFSSTSIKAYTASVSDNKVTLTEATKVKAGEGVVLYCNGGKTEAIPVITEAVEAAATNALIGTLVDIDALATNTTIDDVTYANYILNNGSAGIGFYLAADKKVAAGKAYLQVPTTSAAKVLNIVWNDATGIENNYELGIQNSDVATYDLMGRKVANPTKGLYIKNGQKFIVK